MTSTDMGELSDEELVELVRKADRSDLRAFDLLVRRYQDRVATNCRHISGSPSDADDLTQEVLVKAYFGIPRFEGRSRFSTWIQRIKVNHCLNFLKKKKGRTFLDVDEPAAMGEEALHVEPDADRNLHQLDERQVISEVLSSLSDTVRIPLVMRDMDGFSYQEIAEELDIGLSAVKMRIKRGREEFRATYRSLTGREAT
jgi:RNA polymerase sigma-70 factor (ECF subfamily)